MFGEEEEEVERGEKVDNREIGRLFGAANIKFCPHHTSAERGQPLLMALLISRLQQTTVVELEWDDRIVLKIRMYENIMPSIYVGIHHRIYRINMMSGVVPGCCSSYHFLVYSKIRRRNEDV